MTGTAGMDADLIVVGAGAVGTATALWAALGGAKVLLVDPNPPGAGASFGNAGTIATYACLPVNDPGLFTALPRLLFGRDSPLSVDFGHALRNPRWMLSFLSNCRRGRVAHISETLAALLARADAGLAPLLDAADAHDLMVARGQLTVWSTPRALREARAGLARRRELGVAMDMLTPQDAAAMEPNLRLPIAGAVHYPQARHVRDPQALVTRFAEALEAHGGQIVTARARRVSHGADDVTVTLSDGTELRAPHAVLSAGAHATTLAGSGAERLPLGVERGYHLQFDAGGDMLSRPVGWAEGGFYATPMAQGLRIAGTVEIAHRDAPANPRRIAYLRRKARQMLGDLPGTGTPWLGLRPSFPDALPVIGPSPAGDRITLAFGHQHLGLTLSGATGQIVADLARGRTPNMDLSPCHAERFGTG